MKLEKKKEAQKVRIVGHNKKVLAWIIFLIILLIATVITINVLENKRPINSFEECIAAGNPAMESYPRQCRDPKTDRTFVEDITSENECEVDEDCVRDSCCHASGCVAIESIPLCEGILCSQECVEDTLDCGQGSCQCIGGKCGAVFEQQGRTAE